MTNQQNPGYQQGQNKDKSMDKNNVQQKDKSFENKDKSGKPGERNDERGTDRA
ncbi:MAG: hypothetical protein ACAH80_00640 [Alphaproteobacteria bacterium]